MIFSELHDSTRQVCSGYPDLCDCHLRSGSELPPRRDNFLRALVA